jgi:hypothetical protein
VANLTGLGAYGRLRICHGGVPSDAGGSTTELSATGARGTLAGDIKDISTKEEIARTPDELPTRL